ncbi:hypothetical protein AMK59_2188, partial [Oryctes borbonicus]
KSTLLHLTQLPFGFLVKDAYFLLLFVGLVSAEILHDQSSEEIDPIKQIDDSGEDNEQSKRTLLSNGNHYAWEKHIKYHPSGHKYLLGYRAVKLQLVPVAKPLYSRPVGRPTVHTRPVHIGNKPVLSLVPPKLNPVYKPGGYVYNKPLPVNVPPNMPTKPWQHQGWDTFTPETDQKPFVPSVPLPEPDNHIPDTNFVQPTIPALPPSSFPAIPSIHVQPRPVFNVIPSVPLQPAVPVQPAVPLHPVVPVPPPLPTINIQPAVFPTHVQPLLPLPSPVQPVVPVQPEVPVHPGLPVQTHTILHHHRPMVPINFLPGKLNIPVPDLGVLPLGAQVPVHLSAQQPHIIHKPGIVAIGSSVPLPLFHQQPGIIHKAPVLPVGGSIPVHLLPQQPREIPKIPVVEPPIVQKFVPQLQSDLLPRPQVYLGGPQVFHRVPDGTPAESGFMPVESSPERPHIQISVNQHQPVPNSLPQIPPQQHNFQYFVQHFPGNTVQQQHAINVQPQHYDVQQHDNQNPFNEQQTLHESPGFFQPGKTDLQIPEYLPEHPHFRQMQEYAHDNGYDIKRR